MPNPFDDLKKQLFDITTDTFGYNAEWTPLAGGVKQTARVHFKNPNEQVKEFGNLVYKPIIYRMEYKQGDFIGLYELVLAAGRTSGGANLERVIIEGQNYRCHTINALYDGGYYEVELIKE
jgi:hypothetical protein